MKKESKSVMFEHYRFEHYRASYWLKALVFSIVSLGSGQVAAATTFTDDFEGATLSPFWTASGPGSATLTNSVIHGGAQALDLSASVAFPWNINLTHNFGVTLWGSVSIWVHGQALCCGSGVALQLDSSSGSVLLQQSGNINDPSVFAARVVPSAGPQFSHSFSAAPDVWHQFRIDTSPIGTTFLLDGSVVFSDGAVTGFNQIVLSTWGGPGGTAYLDDFRAEAVPEGSTWCLLLSAIGGLTLFRRRHLA